MTNKSAIEWTEQTWNPIVGCSIVSPGCTNCYAMAMAARINKMTLQSHYEGLTKEVNRKQVWTGKLALAGDYAFRAPLRRRRPTTYFVNSMGDLFHEDVPDEWIDRVFAVMALRPQHTFQVLTKRAQRMRQYLSPNIDWNVLLGATFTSMNTNGRIDVARAADLNHRITVGAMQWPLPNVWLGVSAERQQEADERIPLLLRTPAAVRFISAEPLLGPIDMHLWMLTCPAIDWVIVGGESGPGARPMHPDWARSIRDQCAEADVPFFFKQWGEWLPGEANRGQFDARPLHAYRRCDIQTYEWPSYFQTQNFGTHPDRFSGGLTTKRVGKKAAGRLLDGRLHDAMPSKDRPRTDERSRDPACA